MTDLIEKKSNGQYGLNPKGAKIALYRTAKKLLRFYMQNGLKKNGNYITGKLQSLDPFLEKYFNNLEDFLQKNHLLSDFLEESNLPRFQKFMGQHFLATYDKEKKALLATDMNTHKNKLDNPFHAPGNELLIELAQLFHNSQPLQFPIPGTNNGTFNDPNTSTTLDNSHQTQEQKMNQTNEAKQTQSDQSATPVNVSQSNTMNSHNDLSSNSSSTTVTTAEKPQTSASRKMPGYIMLGLLENRFTQSKHLDPNYMQSTKSISSTPNGGASSTQETTTAQTSVSVANATKQVTSNVNVAESKQIQHDTQTNVNSEHEIIAPGIRMLTEIGAKFTTSPPLSLDFLKDDNDIAPRPASGKQVTLLIYASLMNTISKFSRNSDNVGYKNWYLQLPDKQKAIIQINNFLSKENATNWEPVFKQMSVAFKIDKTSLQRILYDIKLYKSVIRKIKIAMQESGRYGANVKSVQSMYGQLIKLINSDASINEKKTSLKMLLMQEPSVKANTFLAEEFFKIIEFINGKS